MAETAVVVLVGKLGSIIEKEMEHLGWAGEKVQQVQRELIRIQRCLRDADIKRKEDERVKSWLCDLLNVAYRIEDVIDTFFLKVGYNSQNDAIFLQKLKKLCNKPREVYFLVKLGNELHDIQNKLEKISKRMVEYEINDLPEVNEEVAIIPLGGATYSEVDETAIIPLQRATYSEVDESEVVGLQADEKNILKFLHLEETPTRTVITIVGPGGIGKTTLAHMVYRSARANFDYHIMLSISQKFSVTDLLRKMLHQSKISLPENQDVGDLISKLKNFLRNKRYLIILDNVWNNDLWKKLKHALPDAKNGSRILITTRSIEVAPFAESQIPPYKLNFLDDRESLHLLLKKALPYQEPNEACANDLLELARELSKKCNGLPLALIVLGGMLSTKVRSYHAWQRVLQTINSYSDGSDCMGILAMGYDDMPYYLKACFQYLASFPEDHTFSAKRLIRMWVAEGFIPLKGCPTMEIMAEDCLEKLLKSMVQVSSRRMNSLIKHLQMHVLLRDLALHENDVTVFSEESNVNNSHREIRRAFLQAQERNLDFMKYVGPNTRSLLLFGLNWFDVTSECSKFRLLKVLELVGVRNALPMVLSCALKSLEELMHLKYLGFKNWHINVSSCSFHRMKTLETLDMRGTRVKLPNSIWTISTLRHVLCDHYDVQGALDGPISAANLSNLQWVKPQRTWDSELPLLNNRYMCKLGVCEVEDWVAITNLLNTLPSLISLGIKARWYESLPEEIIYPKTLPNYQNLQSLYLKGEWSKNVTLEARLFPPCLVKLTLLDSELGKNPMPELGKLGRLKKLRLGEYVLNYSGPTICRPGFPVLQHLEVTDLNMKDLRVTQGVMPKLTYLHVHPKMKLNLPPELQHVTMDRE